MVNIFEELVTLLKDGKKAILARIIRQVGSAPRSLGAKCLILEDGSVVGSIGGGCLELQVMEAAKNLFQQGKTRILNYQMVGKELAQSEMLCGGIVDVLLEPVFPDNPMTNEVILRVRNLVRDGKTGTLLTLVADGMDHNRHSRVVMEPDGTITGDFEDDLAVDASSNEKWSKASKPVMIEVEEGAPAIFAEPIEPDTVLYLFGAGHISTFVAPLAKMVGFRVCVLDDREDFANSTRFPNADELIVCPFHNAFNRISINASSYIAIITRGHIHDRDVLRDALHTNSAYIGMIGSLRKRQIIYKSLAEEGVSEQTLRQVHSPIGLDIGAETPEEIAVSIVAELIQARLNRAVEKPPLNIRI